MTTSIETKNPALPSLSVSVPRPKPRLSTIVSFAAITGIILLGVWSLVGLDYSLGSLSATGDNLKRFIGMATPMQWPGWNVVGEKAADGTTTYVTEWVGWEPVLKTLASITITLALVISGTALAALLSVPVAYGAASNTTPGRLVQYLCRGIGIVARAIPDVVFVVFLAFLWFNSGTLPAIVAIGLHSVGMISKMFADAIEQVDEGPVTAVISTGGTRLQQFFSVVIPQSLPAWIAVTLHRADINLRSTVILGVVGVVGLGYDLDEALHAGPSGMRRVIPIVLIIIALCILFEAVSSSIRSRLLGARRKGKAARESSSASSLVDQGARVAAALKRPWDRRRIGTLIGIWLTVAVIAWSFIYAAPDLARLFSGWRLDQVSNAELDRAVWPPNFADRSWSEVGGAVMTTLQVAFAATLLGLVISAVVGPLSARNVAPNSWVRNFFRGFALFLRAIPDLVVAILFIIATGFGAQAGALALGIGGVGLLAKLIGDSMEEAPNGPEQAMFAVGGTRPQVFFSSTLPLSMPALVSHLMYLLEQNVRSATLLGIVGAGGIGYLLLNALQGRHFDQVFAYVIVITLMVIAVEAVSMLIRKLVK